MQVPQYFYFSVDLIACRKIWGNERGSLFHVSKEIGFKMVLNAVQI